MKDDKEGMPTPRVDAVVVVCDGAPGWRHMVDADFARQLERELAEARREAKSARDGLDYNLKNANQTGRAFQHERDEIIRTLRKHYTVIQISEMVGLTRQRVHQILNEAPVEPFINWRERALSAEARLAEMQKPGYVMVPVEPGDELVAALMGQHISRVDERSRRIARGCWSIYIELAAVPPPRPERQGDAGPDFNTEQNLHSDTVASRYDSQREDLAGGSESASGQAREAVAPMDPTREMIEAGAQRLVRWETGKERWPDSWSALDVRAARNDAERCWRSMWHAAQAAIGTPQPAHASSAAQSEVESPKETRPDGGTTRDKVNEKGLSPEGARNEGIEEAARLCDVDGAPIHPRHLADAIRKLKR